MDNIVEDALFKGVEMHKAGQFETAKQLYASVIKAEPKHTDANHNTGVIEMDDGNVSQAIPFLKVALEENPDNGQYWVSYIDALIRLKAFNDAQNMLAQARQRGAQGEQFDQLEQRIKEDIKTPQSHEHANSLPPQSQVQDPPQKIIDSLSNLFHQGQLQATLDMAQDLLKQFPNL